MATADKVINTRNRLGKIGVWLGPLRTRGANASRYAADHITTTKLALAQLPKQHRRGRSTLIRTDSAGGTHEFLDCLTHGADGCPTRSE